MALDPATSIRIIDLTNSGEGHAIVNLDGVLVELVTRYNYTAKCWSMDILDDQGALILAGLMLVPGVDILDAYQHEKKTLGSMAVAERTVGDYMTPGLLGITVKIVWTPPGSEAVIP